MPEAKQQAINRDGIRITKFWLSALSSVQEPAATFSAFGFQFYLLRLNFREFFFFILLRYELKKKAWLGLILFLFFFSSFKDLFASARKTRNEIFVGSYSLVISTFKDGHESCFPIVIEISE